MTFYVKGITSKYYTNTLYSEKIVHFSVKYSLKDKQKIFGTIQLGHALFFK